MRVFPTGYYSPKCSTGTTRIDRREITGTLFYYFCFTKCLIIFIIYYEIQNRNAQHERNH